MPKAHFIGICGAGMNAVAKLLKDKGWSISGSDKGAYPPISTYLDNHYISYHTDYKKENIPSNVDLVVIGKHAKLTKEINEEVREAYKQNLTIQSFPEVLEELTKDTNNLVITGSHGKSTSTALTAWCLEKSNKKPSFLIGAIGTTPNTNALIGASNIFVLEGDEYPASNENNKSKFLYYNPTNILITSLAHDHINIFPTKESYIEPFKKLVNLTKNKIIICNKDEDAKQFIKSLNKEVITYSLDQKSDWQATNIKLGEVTTFTLMHKNKAIIELETSLLGKHNIENIVGVSALLLELNLLTKEELQEGVKTFKPLARRLDQKNTNSLIPIFEGFGSSYSKAKSAIEAILLHFKDKELITIFEPHTFSWRNQSYIKNYQDVFEGSKEVLIYKPPTHGAETHDQLNFGEIIKESKKSNSNIYGFENIKEGENILKSLINKNSIILILTSGPMDGFIEKTIQIAENKFPSLNY